MTSKTTRISVNGQTYSSVEQMPPDVRRQYETAMNLLADKDGNGIPDILEGKALPSTSQTGGTITPILTNTTVSRVVVNGKEYSSWDEIPADLRQAFEKARASGNATTNTNVLVTQQSSLTSQPFSITTAGGIRLSLPALFILLLAAVVCGMLIAMKFLR